MTEDKTYRLEASETCRLPVGIEHEGVLHGTVIIDEWCGVDHELLTSPIARKNPAKAMTRVLCRLIQEIPGVMPRKSDPYARIPERYAQQMYLVDRDVVMIQALILSDLGEKEIDFKCPNCGAELQDDISLSDVVVTSHDPSKPTSLPFEFSRGVRMKVDGESVVAKSGVFSFPTGNHQEKIAKYSGEGEMSVFTHLIAQCVSGLAHTNTINAEQARRMSVKDRKVLLELLDANMPGASMQAPQTCSTCANEFSIPIQVSDFFM